MTFPSTHAALGRALAARDYSVPTAVQLAVLDVNAAGRDLLVSAQTGSGKTVAFGLAIAKTLLGAEERFERAAEPLALIIAPTRELALQVQRELAWLYAETGARVITCVGGMDARTEGRQLEQGAHFVVGTPGRLRDHLERKRLNLTKLRTVVLDEADEMLDLGFREDLEFILSATPESRQTLLFSATMPREIENLARRFQRDAIRIETSRRDEQHADIEYKAIRVAPHDIENAVVNVLRFHEMRATLVFCATREAVKRLHARLLERGFSAVALSGELTQHERTAALQALRDGRARVLVATDVAARGLDLPDLALVIHADLPNDRETLLHRSGRTGRAGKKGLCTLIVPFNRRRKADVLLSAAKLKVTWGNAPTADEIRARDQERFLADAIFTETPTEEELAAARELQAGRSASEIALALVRIHLERLPAPEDLAEDTGPPKRDYGAREGRGNFERPDRPARARREDNRDMVWFRLNIGRERNADPRWLIPLICKAGGITKSEIGLIKINDRDTRFQIAAEIAEQFDHSARTNKNKEGHISRAGVYTAADDAAVAEAINAIGGPNAASKAGDVTAAPAIETPFNARPKAPWKDRSNPRPGKHISRKSNVAQSEKGEFRKSIPHRDTSARPHSKKPWHDRNDSEPNGRFAGKRDERVSNREAAPKSTVQRDVQSHSPSKAPWRDRNKEKAGPHAHRKGGGKWSGGSAAPHSPAPRTPSHGAAAHASGGPPKPASKYAHKKKHRKGSIADPA